MRVRATRAPANTLESALVPATAFSGAEAGLDAFIASGWVDALSVCAGVDVL